MITSCPIKINGIERNLNYPSHWSKHIIFDSHIRKLDIYKYKYD
ncbi:hypothetical protein DSUL_30097 [Desulfovibrionales bacterium]